MRIYLRAFILNLTKKNPEIAKMTALPGKLNRIEKEMKAGKLTSAGVMEKLRGEGKLQSILNEREWKMIEFEIKKMIK